MRKELLAGLTEEQIAKVQACKNNDEVLALAKEEGIELNDDQLEAVNGGACTCTAYGETCPKCHSTNMARRDAIYGTVYICRDCGYEYDHYAGF